MVDTTAVAAAVATLEQAAGSVPADLLGELDRPDVRDVVAAELHRAGRALVVHRSEGSAVAYASGYADDVAEQLHDDGFGGLDQVEAATLSLVLLHTVAVPTALGHPPVPWSAADGVGYDQLDNTRDRALSKSALRTAVNRLHAAGLLHNARGSGGIRPGPALDRLTDAQRRRVEIRLLRVVAGDDPIVAALAAELDRPSTSAPTPTGTGGHDD